MGVDYGLVNRKSQQSGTLSMTQSALNAGINSYSTKLAKMKTELNNAKQNFSDAGDLLYKSYTSDEQQFLYKLRDLQSIPREIEQLEKKLEAKLEALEKQYKDNDKKIQDINDEIARLMKG